MGTLASTAPPVQRWIDRRRRAEVLLEREPHAAELLRLYLALADAWMTIAAAVAADPPAPGEVAEYAASSAMPLVIERTLVAGPELLRGAVVSRFHEADPAGLVRAWLEGAEQEPVDRYLARASATAVVETAPDLVRSPVAGRSDPRLCPNCGAGPQLSWVGLSDDPLVSAPRQLVCSRCALEWAYPRMVCAGCGNEDATRLPIFDDHDRFAALRVDACEACRGYLVSVIQPKEREAVPVVDELVALPLDLYARERGFRKITPNLMGF